MPSPRLPRQLSGVKMFARDQGRSENRLGELVTEGIAQDLPALLEGHEAPRARAGGSRADTGRDQGGVHGRPVSQSMCASRTASGVIASVPNTIGR